MYVIGHGTEIVELIGVRHRTKIARALGHLFVIAIQISDIRKQEVVIRECAKSPNFWDEATTPHNVLRKYSVDQVKGTDFDPKSIMLYFFPASWTLNGIGTDANEVLSLLDKEFIAGAREPQSARSERKIYSGSPRRAREVTSSILAARRM